MLLDEISSTQTSREELQEGDRLLAVACTWADHFGHKKPQARAAFIERYVRRAREHRFWGIGCTVSGKQHAACRLGDILFFYDGKTVQARNLGSRPRSSWSTPGHAIKNEILRWGGTLYTKVQLPTVTPEGAHIGALIRRLRPVVAKKVSPTAVFDSMTTFSKAYRGVALNQVKDDAGLTALTLTNNTDCRYSRPRMSYYMGLGASALKRFLAHLDPEILRTVRGVGCPTFTLYNWIAAGDVERRIQAVRTYPLMVPYLILKWEQHKNAFLTTNARPPYGMHVESIQLGDLVDSGETIAQLLAKACHCTERMVRTASHFPVRHTGSILRLIGLNGWDETLDSIYRAACLGNRVPKGKAEWGVWFRLMSALPWSLLTLGDESGWGQLMAGSPAWSDPEWEELLPRCRDIGDLELDTIGDHGHGTYGGLGYAQSLPHIPKWPLRRYLSLSAKWHRERDALVRSLSKEDEESADSNDFAWERMLPEHLVHAPSGVEIVELVVPEDLHLEGKALRHCVDGYSDFCYSGRSRIISLRMDGRPLATAEFRLTPYKEKPSVRNLYCAQLRGLRNAVIPAKSPEGQAFSWLFREIRSRKIPAVLEWPDVPADMRPERMHDRNERVREMMSGWLEGEMRKA